MTNLIPLLVACFFAARACGLAPQETIDSSALAQPAALFDALIASGYGSETLSWSDMTSVLECATAQDNIASLKCSIQDIIDNFLVVANRDMGRVVQYTPAEAFNLGENYEAIVKGVTLSCYLVITEPKYDDIYEKHIGPGAYASQIMASTMDIFPSELRDPRKYNLTMLVEADILELGDTGRLYVPKKHCLDFDESDWGIMKAEEGRHPNFAKRERTRPVAMGLKVSPLTSFMNRVNWLLSPKLDLDADIHDRTPNDWIKSAYTTPKAELLAMLQAQDEGHELCSVNSTYLQCFQEVERIVTQEYGLEYDYEGAVAAANSDQWMWERREDWIATQVNEAANITEEKVPFPVPLVYDKSIAEMYKNGGFLAVLANPYGTVESQLTRIGASNAVRDNLHNCVVQANGTSEAILAALQWPSALKRRLNEYRGSPNDHLLQWTLFDDVDEEGFPYGRRYFPQNVSWDDRRELRAGNLTEKVMGKTAEWLVVTNYTDSSVLHNLFLEHEMMSDEGYAAAASDAVRVDNPCGEAVTNSEIYLLMIGVAIAVFGGVIGAAGSLHSLLYWTSGFGTTKSKHQQGEEQEVRGARKFWPTYECWISLFGIIVFVGLFAPLVYTYIIEKEISEFKTSEANLVARNHYYQIGSEYGFERPTFGGMPTLVTFVHVETGCEEARPQLMAALLGVSIAFGVIFNLPFFCSTWRAWVRYWNRFWKGRDNTTGLKCTRHDSEITLLNPRISKERDGSNHAVAEQARKTLAPNMISGTQWPPNDYSI